MKSSFSMRLEARKKWMERYELTRKLKLKDFRDTIVSEDPRELLVAAGGLCSLGHCEGSRGIALLSESRSSAAMDALDRAGSLCAWGVMISAAIAAMLKRSGQRSASRNDLTECALASAFFLCRKDISQYADNLSLAIDRLISIAPPGDRGWEENYLFNFVRWLNARRTKKALPKLPFGAYAKLMEAWDDDTKFYSVLSVACDSHFEYCLDDDDRYFAITQAPYDVLPFELGAALSVREDEYQGRLPARPNHEALVFLLSLPLDRAHFVEDEVVEEARSATADLLHI